MTISSGFFNSHNHDRLYDAEQLSSIFDGVIIDGVYENYGDAFMITANPEANSSVLVGTGRAWFDHTWTLNDSTYALQLDPPNEMLGRIDAIVIDVDHRDDVRKNSIIYIKGSESTPDIPPALVNEELHHQYPIAYITRPAGPDSPISQSQIDYQVGTTGECPIVTGILESQNLENIWQQLNAEFDEWWDGVKATLDENTVTNLQNQINELKEKIEGDDALVGLLTKPVYEKFKKGNYGLSASSYSAEPDDGTGFYWSTVEDAQCGAFFLPDGYVVHTWINKNNHISGNVKISVDLIDKSGIVKTEESNEYSVSSSNNGAVGINVFPISIDHFPVEYGVVILSSPTEVVSSPYNYRASFITITVTSSKIISFGDASYSELSGTIPKASGSYKIYNLVCGHGCSLPSGQFITASGYGKTRSSSNYINVFSRSSDGIVTSKQTVFGSSLTAGLFGVVGSSLSSYFPVYMVYTKDSKVLICGFKNSGAPSYVGAYGYIDPLSLNSTITVVNNSGTDPAHPVLDWTPPEYFNVLNDYASYSVDESTGVVQNAISEFSDEESSSKVLDYFIGASNANIAIPSGIFISGLDSNGMLGVAPSGNQMYIGTNGGAAILNKKVSAPASNEQQRLIWCKGYIDTESVLGYMWAEDIHTTDTYNGLKSWIFSGTYPIKLSVVMLNKE